MQNKKEEQKHKDDKTEENGYGASSDKNCPLCNDVFNPVCGINGVTYQNLCKLRECARVDTANYGPCGIPNYRRPRETKECACTFKFDPVCGSDHVTW